MSTHTSRPAHDADDTTSRQPGVVEDVTASLRARSEAMTAVLTELGFEAGHAGQWIDRFVSRIGYARGGDQSAAGELNRADLVDDLRVVSRHRAIRGAKTTMALTALTRIENEFFGGVRIPEPTVRQRFCPAQGSVWDKLLNRWYCHDCGLWAEQDHHSPLLGGQCSCTTEPHHAAAPTAIAH
ncbi:MAG: hypothetical protein QOF58_1435 [Pseudonocardiales bacterium]|jgi:hypothetical protein|nr:hypothetical protein [Pseudonocardiales bacterium]